MAVQDINATTVADLIAQTADAQEVLWMATVNEDEVAVNPFAALMGGMDSVMPIKKVMDTSKVAGQEVVITQFAGLGGKGVQGSTVLEGSEEELKENTWRIKVGRHRHAAAFTDLLRRTTLLGKNGVERLIHTAVRNWLSRLKCDTVEATMIGEAEEYNTLYANNKTSIDALTSADYMSEDTISEAKIKLSANGGEPMNVNTEKGGNLIEKFYFLGSAVQFGGLRQSGTWKSILGTAGDRGRTNFLFGGNLPEWDGVLLNEWKIKRTSADAAQGAFAAPEAYLGVQIVAKATSDTFSTSIKGGGLQGTSGLTAIAAAKTNNDYFRYFPNAPYSAFDKTYIQANTSDRKVVMIQHASGTDKGKFSFLSYTTCDGFQLGASDGSDLKRLGSTATGDYETTLSGSSITWGTAPWTAAYLSEGLIPINSKIVPCNSKGQPWVRGYALANNAIAMGYGSFDGSAQGAFGNRIKQTQDYGNKIGLGIDLIFGTKACEDASKIKPGFVLVYSSYNLPGMPDVV